MSDTQIKIVCPDHPDTELHRFSPYGAPGIGWDAQCPVDDKHWAVVGGVPFEPDDFVHIESLDNFR